MKYIYILDYENGWCEITTFFNDDPEKWLANNGYNLNNIHWMVTETPNLNINL